MLIKLNDIVIDDVVVIPVVYRPSVQAVSLKLKVALSGWDSLLALLNGWYREA